MEIRPDVIRVLLSYFARGSKFNEYLIRSIKMSQSWISMYTTKIYKTKWSSLPYLRMHNTLVSPLLTPVEILKQTNIEK